MFEDTLLLCSSTMAQPYHTWPRKWNSLWKPQCRSKNNFTMGRRTLNSDPHPICKGFFQHSGSLPQQTESDHLYRVDASPRLLHSPVEALELSYSGSVCHEAQLQTSKLRLIVSGSNGNSYGCFPLQLGTSRSFPLFLLTLKVLKKLITAHYTNLIHFGHRGNGFWTSLKHQWTVSGAIHIAETFFTSPTCADSIKLSPCCS